MAARQHAVITTVQLRALGLGRGAIAHRVTRGLLVPLHRGVYLWGRADPSLHARAQAGLFACGPDAVVSHHAAVAVHGIRPATAGAIDVTIPRRRARVAGLRTHDGALTAADRIRVEGIAVTSPARALLEVAPELTPRELANAVERATVEHLVTKRELLGAIERAPRRAGTTALRVLAEDEAFTRSHAERKLVALLRAARLPEPVFNAMAGAWEVDALWTRERLVLEFDSYGFHATRAAFERDRRKTSELTRARYVVLTTTWTELTRQPYALIARTAEALTDARARVAG